MSQGDFILPDEEPLVGPWDCRSMDCNDQAIFYADIPDRWLPGHQKDPGWEGHFCAQHLLRVLPLKMDDLHGLQEIRIRRVWG